MKVQVSILRTKSAYGCHFRKSKGTKDIILTELALGSLYARLSVKVLAVISLSFLMVRTVLPLNSASKYKKALMDGTSKKTIKYS